MFYKQDDINSLKKMRATYIEFYETTKERSGLAILNCIDFFLMRIESERLAECAKSEYLICKN